MTTHQIPIGAEVRIVRLINRVPLSSRIGKSGIVADHLVPIRRQHSTTPPRYWIEFSDGRAHAFFEPELEVVKA
jgi:hypothetical protein